MVHTLLAQAGFSLADIGLIGFDAGPGSFTGLRIGCGLAQGLALGIGCPVVPVSSLQALAWPHGALPTLTATDARMGEIYQARWVFVEGEPEAIGAGLHVGPPADLAALIDRMAIGLQAGESAGQIQPSRAWVATGDAFARYPELAAHACDRGASVFDDAFPRADAIAELAARAWMRGEAIAADDAAPIYVRNKVALDVDEQLALRAARDAAR